jgi:protein gp37
MGLSKIEWTDYTFNPWIGCMKVSEGCQHCYAEVYGNRFGVEWGPSGLRRRTSEGNWRKPLAWNEKANREGVTPRVFCASLADVFEGREETLPWLNDLLHLIARCSGMTWLLLTKRPESVMRLIATATGRHASAWLEDNGHVWIGTSVENQAMADRRIPELVQIPAARRFLSCEPLLGPVNLFDVSGWSNAAEWWGKRIKIDWVICGGESGPDARPMHPGWARSLRDQCVSANVPFLFKQWGEFHPVVFDTGDGDIGVLPSGLIDCDVKPKPVAFDGEMERIGKKAAGRMLDGRTWDETPK